MSKDWTPEEIQIASEAMKTAGNMGYEEFCEELNKNGFAAISQDSPAIRLKPEVQTTDK